MRWGKTGRKKIEREGRLLVGFIEERGWGIYNGVIRGDEGGIHVHRKEGEYRNY